MSVDQVLVITVVKTVDMATAFIWDVGPFKPKEERWENYKTRLELWMTTNKVKDDLKAATLLTMIGPQAFETVTSLAFPAKVTEKSYAQILDVLEKTLPNR